MDDQVGNFATQTLAVLTHSNEIMKKHPYFNI